MRTLFRAGALSAVAVSAVLCLPARKRVRMGQQSICEGEQE